MLNQTLVYACSAAPDLTCNPGICHSIFQFIGFLIYKMKTTISINLTFQGSTYFFQSLYVLITKALQQKWGSKTREYKSTGTRTKSSVFQKVQGIHARFETFKLPEDFGYFYWRESSAIKRRDPWVPDRDSSARARSFPHNSETLERCTLW